AARGARGAGHAGDPRDVEVDDAAPLEQHGHDPARHVQALRDAESALRQSQDLLHVSPAVGEEVRDRERIGHLEALGALEDDRQEVRNPPKIGHRRGLGQIEHGGDGRLDACPRDPHAVVGLGFRLAVEGNVHRLREARIDGLDLRVPENFLVPAERLASDRVVELLALAEDRELLPGLRAAALADVQIERAVLEADHERLEGRERLDEVLRHETEGRADAVRHPCDGARARGEHAEHGEADEHADLAAQIATDGWWTPNTERRRSQISPSVLPASTPVTSSGERLARPRAALSSASSARPTAARSRVARVRATRSARAWLTVASTWKRLPGGGSSVTNSLTPTTTRA